ncbi:BZIP transcription factor [Actinidia chinensis var. chinensis]|uniref:BZIP transcription factor n=1 Tax=Actinidia chinensis var. chinensis TaxID=1590841 RepID=A0A2R6S168_ACTCC|nr:BZIP transcription factor [Actinidia chinensis var. chinensis]
MICEGGICNICSLRGLIVLHGHAEGDTCWSSQTSKTWCMAHSLCRSISASDTSRWFCLLTISLWCVIKWSRFVSSRFPTRSRFRWFLRFSKCFFLRIRDRLADSRFDIIRLSLRSSGSGPGWVVSSEPGLELLVSGFELEFEVTGFGLELSGPEWDRTGSWRKEAGSWGGKGESGSWQSQGVKPPSKAGNGIPKNPSGTGMAEKADSMAGKKAYR